MVFLKALTTYPYYLITNKRPTVGEHLKLSGHAPIVKFKKALEKECLKITKKGLKRNKIHQLHELYRICMIVWVISLAKDFNIINLLILTTLFPLTIISWYLYAECPITTLEKTIKKQEEEKEWQKNLTQNKTITE